MLYHITELTYDRLSVRAIVYGIANAIVEAHLSIQPATVWLSSGLLYGANINRSPYALQFNPEI